MRSHTFICGCGHSGTSLVAAMFASHPDVFIPLRESDAFLDSEAAPARWARLLAEAEASGRPHFAEKTPRHIRHLGLIRHMVPNARFVVMVRDGRDVAASFIKRYGAAETGAERWLADNRIVLAEREAPDVAVLRYEDLVAAPEAEMRRICAFAGIDFAPQMLSYHETPRLWFGVTEITPGTGEDGREHMLLRNWQINQPLYDARGTWRRLLQKTDLARFDTAEMRELMTRFGYD